jgi:hypothetical protein
MKFTTANGVICVIAAAAIPASGAAAAAKPKPPVPPIDTVTVMPPPPAPVVPVLRESPQDSARIQRALQEVVTLDVEILGGGERLWLGSMRVNNQNSGEYTANLRQAPPCSSTDDTQRYYGGLQNQLNLSIQRRGYDSNVDGFQIRTNWVHSQQECASERRQVTVGFEQSFTLRPGESTQIVGDGGLLVKISRRR